MFHVLQVQGKSAVDHYLVFPAHYCSCHAFFYEVVGRSEAPFVSLYLVLRLFSCKMCDSLHFTMRQYLFLQCKHQIAARVAETSRRCQITVVPDHVLAEILLEA